MGQGGSSLHHWSFVYNAREGLNITAFAFTDSTWYVPIIYLPSLVLLCSNSFSEWRRIGPENDLIILTVTHRSFGRSFSRHVQHHSQKCNLKRPRINFFIGERRWFLMWCLLFQIHKDWPWKWPHHPNSRSLGPLAGPLAGILSVKVKNITLKGQESTSSGNLMNSFPLGLLWQEILDGQMNSSPLGQL